MGGTHTHTHWGGPAAEQPGQLRHEARQGLFQGQSRWQPARAAMACQAPSWLPLSGWVLGLSGVALWPPGHPDDPHPCPGTPTTLPAHGGGGLGWVSPPGCQGRGWQRPFPPAHATGHDTKPSTRGSGAEGRPTAPCPPQSGVGAPLPCTQLKHSRYRQKPPRHSPPKPPLPNPDLYLLLPGATVRGRGLGGGAEEGTGE